MPAARVVALVLLLGAAAVWGAQTVRKAERSTGNDLVAYLAASEALYAGGDPYRQAGRFPYIYPLFLATVVRPLAALPIRAAAVLWFVAQCACLVYVLRGTRLRLGRYALTGTVALSVIVAVYGDVLQNEFLNGQVNLFVLALVVAAAAAANAKGTATASGGSHLSLGAAIAVKLTPALMLVYLAVERRFWALLLSVVSAVVFVLLPWLVVGNRLWTLYREYVTDFVLARTGALDPAHITFSVYGLFGKLTGVAPSRPVILMLAAAVVGAIVLSHLSLRVRDRHPVAWVYLAATPLLSPMSEVHHLTATLPLAAVAGGHAHRAAVAIPLAAFAVLLWIGRFDRRGPWYFLAVVALLIAGLMAIRANPEQD